MNKLVWLTCLVACGNPQTERSILNIHNLTIIEDTVSFMEWSPELADLPDTIQVEQLKKFK